MIVKNHHGFMLACQRAVEKIHEEVNKYRVMMPKTYMEDALSSIYRSRKVIMDEHLRCAFFQGDIFKTTKEVGELLRKYADYNVETNSKVSYDILVENIHNALRNANEKLMQIVDDVNRIIDIKKRATLEFSLSESDFELIGRYLK